MIPANDGDLIGDAYLTWGSAAIAEAIDPYVVLNESKSNQTAIYTRPANADRALWRDLDALLLEGSERTPPPRAFRDLATLPRDTKAALRVRALGFDQDGQASDTQYFSAVTPPLIKLLDERTARYVRSCRVAAEEAGRQLAGVARLAWNEAAMNRGTRLDRAASGPWAARASATYWPEAERCFWRLLDEGPETEPLTRFVEIAEKALNDAVGPAAATQPGAKALSHATALLRRLLPKNHAHNERGAKE
jgi:CRISPR system Cascade subunit CasA